MSYTVLARKYRPQAFEEMTGQEHVVRTVENAIKLDRVAHAYLFAALAASARRRPPACSPAR
jgi:DNA polymerase-3 subunit gamma/tau